MPGFTVQFGQNARFWTSTETRSIVVEPEPNRQIYTVSFHHDFPEIMPQGKQDPLKVLLVRGPVEP